MPTGKYGENREYTPDECPHDGQYEYEDSEGYQMYFCPDCGSRAEGDSG